MAFIEYLPADRIPADRIPVDHRISDQDNILQIHGVHSRVLKLHLDLYVELMHRTGPLTRVQREMIATTVSNLNDCLY